MSGTNANVDEEVTTSVENSADEVAALKKENERLRKKIEEMEQALKTTQDELAALKQNPHSSSETDDEDVKVNRLYKFGKVSLDKGEVRDVLRGLKEPYKTEIRNFIKENKIRELQIYLNKLIDDNIIDKLELRRVCEEKGIWLYENTYILADGKFGPQTMEAIKMIKENQEEKDPFKDVKVKEEVEVPEEREVEAGDLVDLPEGAEVEFEEGSSVDKTKNGEEQEVTIVVKIGENVKKITIIVIVDVENKKMDVKEKKEEEKDPFKDVKVKEEIELPEGDKAVEAKDLVDLPEGATVEFKDDKGVDKEKTDEQEITLIVKIGDKTKEIVIIVKIEDGKIRIEDKEEKEKAEKLKWFEDLKIEDLGTWDKNGDFVFKEGLINDETKELTINDKTIPMIEDGSEGFGYMVKNGLLRIGNIKNGVLDGYGVEFYPYGEEYRDENSEANLNGIKSRGEWENGKLKNGSTTARENGLDVHIDIKNFETTKCYTDDELISFDMESKGDDLYIKNGDSSLKLKNKYSVTRIAKILYDYKDQEGSFSTDLAEGYKSKKLLWKSASSGEEKLVYNYADDFVIDVAGTGSEGQILSGWLNEYRETHKEFKLEDYGEFDSEGKFVFKDGMEQTDENGKKYIEYNKEKYYEYEDGMNRKGYNTGTRTEDNEKFGWLYLGNFENGLRDGKGILIWSDGLRYEGEFKNSSKEGKGTTIWANGNKFEGEYKEDMRVRGKFTIVTPEEIKGEYEVQRDEKGLRIVSGEHEGKYINDEEWKIEEKTESPENEVEEIKLEELGEFVDGTFKFKNEPKKTDDGKTYVEYGGNNYYEYEGGMSKLGYRIGKGYLYIGNFVEGKIEGKGTMVWSDGDKIEGEWKNNQAEGQGKTTWANGNKFEGERKENKIEKGKFTLVTPDEIKGDYEVERDEKGLRITSGESKGKYLDAVNWKIEDKLEEEFSPREFGEFTDDSFKFEEGVEKTDENGKKYIEYKGDPYYQYEDGRSGLSYKIGKDYLYIGNCVNGKLEGKGIMIWNNYAMYQGEWVNNQVEGQGTTRWAADLKKFKGEYKENKIEKGKFTIEDPEEIKGEYEVERDEKGLRIISEGENNGKYINYKEWKIEEKIETTEEKSKQKEQDNEGEWF